MDGPSIGSSSAAGYATAAMQLKLSRGNMDTMKKVALVILLIVPLLLVALPMGMGEMGDCPACTQSERPLALGMCLAIIALAIFSIRFSRSRVFLASPSATASPPAAALFRPPRAV